MYYSGFKLRKTETIEGNKMQSHILKESFSGSINSKTLVLMTNEAQSKVVDVLPFNKTLSRKEINDFLYFHSIKSKNVINLI